jgi:hypothetical protein
MSSVLSALVSPCAPAITPNYTALLCDPEFKNVIKSLFFTLLEEDTEFKDTVRVFIDCSITMSEHNILKRISTTEKVLGLSDYPAFCDEEEHEPTIPEQIKQLSERLEQPLNKSNDSIKMELPVIPKTTLEHKAVELTTHLIAKMKPGKNEVFMDNAELNHFFKSELSPELRSTDTNLRRVKKDVITKAMKLFPESVFISKAKHGKKEIRALRCFVWISSQKPMRVN